MIELAAGLYVLTTLLGLLLFSVYSVVVAYWVYLEVLGGWSR